MTRLKWKNIGKAGVFKDGGEIGLTTITHSLLLILTTEND